MSKHIYVNVPDITLTSYLRGNLIHPNEYDPISFSKLHQYEFGKLHVGSNVYHFLLGKIINRQKETFCCWCSYPVKLVEEKLEKPMPLESIIRKFYECDHCGSRGPILNCRPNPNDAQEDWEEDVIKNRYETRRDWWNDFKNPYDGSALEKDEE